ncbi:hypothetical protein V3C99_000038, partial [Haemonchus contortus]
VCPAYQFYLIGPIKESVDTTLTALYFRATSSLMAKMVNTVSDSTIHSSGKVLNDTSKVKSAVVRSLLEYPMAFAMLALWVLLAVLVLMSIGFHFAYRLRHPRKSKRPSGQRLLWAALAFGLCFITSLIGLTLYSISLFRVQEGIEDLPLQLKRTTYQVMGFTNRVDWSAECHLENIYNDHVITARGIISEIKEALNKSRIRFNAEWLEQVQNEFYEYKKTISSLKIQLKKVEIEGFRDAMEPIVEKLHELALALTVLLSGLYSETIDTNKMLNRALKDLNSDGRIAKRAIRNYTYIFYDAVTFVNESTIRVLEGITDVVSKKESSGIIKIFGYSIQIPVILVMLSILALGLVMAGWTFHMGRDRYDSRRSRRGAVAIVAASVLGGAGYTAMVIGTVLCVLVAFCFLVSFAAAIVYVGFFVDDYLRLFNAIPNLHFRAELGTQEMNYSLHDTFYNCKNGYKFFDAFNGSHTIAATEVEKQFKLLQRGEDLALKLLGNDIIISYKKTLNSSLSEAIRLHEEVYEMFDQSVAKLFDVRLLFLCYSDFTFNARIAPHFLSGMWELLEGRVYKKPVPVSDKEYRDHYAKLLNNSILRLKYTILITFANMSGALSDISPKCDNIIRIWDVMGYYVGNFIMAPVQGLWVAYMICVIGSAPIYHSFFSVSQFLQDYAESVRKTYLRETQRLEELRYVHRKMAELEESTQDDLSEDVLDPSQGSAATPNDSVGGAGETQKKSDFSNEVALEGKESSFSKETDPKKK